MHRSAIRCSLRVLSRIVTYIDGPFYPDESLKGKARKEALRNQVYEAMVERSKLNTIELAKYIKK